MKFFKMFLFTLSLCMISSVAFAEKSTKSIDWSEEEIVAYVNMSVGTYLEQAKLTSPKDAQTRVSLHIAKTCQILRNEGIIYRYDVTTSTQKNLLIFSVDIEQDVDSDPFTIEFSVNSTPTGKKA